PVTTRSARLNGVCPASPGKARSRTRVWSLCPARAVASVAIVASSTDDLSGVLVAQDRDVQGLTHRHGKRRQGSVEQARGWVPAERGELPQIPQPIDHRV